MRRTITYSLISVTKCNYVSLWVYSRVSMSVITELRLKSEIAKNIDSKNFKIKSFRKIFSKNKTSTQSIEFPYNFTYVKT